MRPRSARVRFDDFFSTADLAHVNWMTGSPRTILSGYGATGHGDGHRCGGCKNGQANCRACAERVTGAPLTIESLLEETRAADRHDVYGESARKRPEPETSGRHFDRIWQAESAPSAVAHSVGTAIPERGPGLEPWRSAFLRNLLESVEHEDGVHRRSPQVMREVARGLLDAEVNGESERPPIGRQTRSGLFDVSDGSGYRGGGRRSGRVAGLLDGSVVPLSVQASGPPAKNSDAVGAPPEPAWRKAPAPPPPAGPGCMANRKMVTCRSKKGRFGTVSFPRPESWPDEMGEGDYDFHEYEYETVGNCVPRPGEEAAFEARLFRELMNDPTPGRNDRATPEGQVNDVGALGVPEDVHDYFGLRNDVKSYVIEQNGQKFIVNVTEGNHTVAPGYVVRTIVRRPDGRYAILTFGAGADWTQSPRLTPPFKTQKTPFLPSLEIPSLPNPAYYFAEREARRIWEENSKGVLERACRGR